MDNNQYRVHNYTNQPVYCVVEYSHTYGQTHIYLTPSLDDAASLLATKSRAVAETEGRSTWYLVPVGVNQTKWAT